MLLDAEFVVAEPRCASALLVDRFGRDLMHRVPISMVTGSLSALRRMVGHGRGVALLPQVTAARYLQAGELVRLNGPAGIAPVTIEARWRTGLGKAEHAVHALVRLASRNQPTLPEQASQPA
jgi:DNA-binding transcriptional LysR family regulator